jgi:uncharacterized protein YgiM (DUF1202 family)
VERKRKKKKKMSFEQSIEAEHFVLARWDYVAKGIKMSSGDVDLSFKKGQRMKVLAICPNEWLRVEFNENTGVIPKPYVKSESSTSSGKVEQESFVEALWSYTATGSRMSTGDLDISFPKGAIMQVLQRYPNDWIQVSYNGKVKF